MAGFDITFLAAKAHAYRPSLLTPINYQNLITAKTLEDLVNILYTTSYKTYLLKLTEINPKSLNATIKSVFEERIETFISLLPEDYYRFINSYFLRYDIPGIIRILGEKSAGISHKELDEYKFRFSITNFEKLLYSRGAEDLILNLPRKYFGRAIDLAINLWKRYSNIYVVELALRKGCIEHLLEIMDELPDEEKSLLRHIIGIEVDFLNLAIALGPMLYGYSPELLEEMLINFSYKISPITLKQIYGSDPRLLTRVVPPLYRKAVEAFLLMKDQVAFAEQLRLELANAIKVMRSEPMEFPYVFSLIKLFEIEYYNLKTLVDGLAQGLTTEYLSALLVF